MPGSLPNSPTNKNVVAAHTAFTRFTPKLEQPKIGFIETRAADILARTKAKKAFAGTFHNSIVFSKQTKGGFPRRVMAHLGGDNFFNKWHVPAIPFAKLLKCSSAEYSKLFHASVDAATFEEGDEIDDDLTADELTLKDSVIPFPQEIDMEFGKELIEVFDADILVLLHGGTGEMVKAVLAKQRHAVVICSTAAQKVLIQTNLRDWTKRMNLVNFADAPTKPANLIAYERGVTVQSSAKAPPTAPANVIPNTTAPAPVPSVVVPKQATPTAPPHQIVMPKAALPPAQTNTSMPSSSGASMATLAAFGSSLL